jgi:uncharacterized damage-inducible protein DinB
MTLLDELLQAWHYTRDGVIAEIDNLPEAQINVRPQGLGRSALDLANHIVESGWLMAGELSNPSGDFRRKSYPDLVDENMKSDVANNKAEALEVLQRSHVEGDALLRDAGEELLLRPIRQFNGVYATRLAWIHHGISHEEYHRGQLALYARWFGVTPALTKAIYGS